MADDNGYNSWGERLFKDIDNERKRHGQLPAAVQFLFIGWGSGVAVGGHQEKVLQFLAAKQCLLMDVQLFLFDQAIDQDRFRFIAVWLFVEDFFQFKEMILIRTYQQETAVLFQDTDDLFPGDRRKDGQNFICTSVVQRHIEDRGKDISCLRIAFGSITQTLLAKIDACPVFRLEFRGVVAFPASQIDQDIVFADMLIQFIQQETVMVFLQEISTGDDHFLVVAAAL